MSKETHDAELNALGNALSALRPHPGQFDRDRLLFQAGQASVQRGWHWPAATAALAIAAMSLGGLLLLRPVPSVVERVVYVLPRHERATSEPDAPAQALTGASGSDGAVLPQPPASSEPFENSLSVAEPDAHPPCQVAYLQLRKLALEKGVDALPRPPSTPYVVHPLSIEGLSEVPPGTLRYPSYLFHDEPRQPGDPL